MRDDMASGISVIDACAAIPRLTREEWRATHAISRWLIGSRAPVLAMTFSSAAIGGALALLDGRVDVVGWVLCVVGLLLAHAANNQLNDLTDSMLGLDRDDSFRARYGVHVLEQGLWSQRQLFVSFGCTGGLALAIGSYLCVRVGPTLLLPLAAGAFFLLAYTWPLKRLGLGELAVWLVWGPLMTAGSYVVASGHWRAATVVVGAVQALAPTTVIFGKHLDKLAYDAERGVRTLPVRLGSVRARRAVVAMVFLAHIGIAALVASRMLPWPSLVVLLALPAAVRVVRSHRAPAPSTCPVGYPSGVWPLWYSAHAFVHARAFGLLLLAGLAAAAMMRAWAA